LIEINSKLTQAVGSDAFKTPLKPVLLFEKTTPATTGKFEVFQNQPNPFSDETLIQFVLPENTETQLSIFDAQGKLVKTSTQNFEKGLQQWRISREELAADGVYFYEIRTEKNTIRRRMVANF
jgi:hypothetical protein